jgi:hypothetical protein
MLPNLSGTVSASALILRAFRMPLSFWQKSLLFQACRLATSEALRMTDQSLAI